MRSYARNAPARLLGAAELADQLEGVEGRLATAPAETGAHRVRRVADQGRVAEDVGLEVRLQVLHGVPQDLIRIGLVEHLRDRVTPVREARRERVIPAS